MRIDEVLADMANRAPDRPAIGAEGRAPLTFGALGTQLRYVNERLAAWGFGPGDIVAAMIPQRPEMAVALLTFPGTVTFAPLGPRTGPLLAESLLTRLGARAVLIPADLDHPVAQAAARLGVVRIDLVPDPGRPAGMFTLRLQRTASADIPRRPECSSYAYILPSSGTTGKRKLVPFHHARMVTSAAGLERWLRLTSDDLALHVMPLHAAHGINMGLTVPVFSGGMAHFCDDGDVGQFFETFGRLRPTWFTAGFTFYRELLRTAEKLGPPPGSRLRFARCGSGMLNPEEIAAFERMFGAPLLMGLAAQETLTVALEAVDRTVVPGRVGRPLINEIALMDESGAPPPDGAPGEIVVRGPTVFDGYFDDPALTAQSFSGGWYRTGDLGRFDADGYLYMSGRLKEIINRGGDKISPVEVDAALRDAPGVAEAAAFGVPHSALGEEIGIAVVREPGATGSDDETAAGIMSRLAAWRVRPRIFFCGKLPRTETGKIRRGLLPELCVTAGRELRKPRRAPSTPFEHALCGLWGTVLGVPEPGVDDDFFALGGDSLRGASLLGQVASVFGVTIQVSQLFADAGTIAGMARLVAGGARAGGLIRG